MRMRTTLRMMMKSLLLSIVFLLCGSNAYAQIDMNIIAFIESSYDVNAYNAKSQATGMYQITPICLRDFKMYHKEKDYSLDDMYIEDKCYEVANWYMNTRIKQLLKHYKLPDTTNNRLVAYNAGINFVRKAWKIPRETAQYINKYVRAVRETRGAV